MTAHATHARLARAGAGERSFAAAPVLPEPYYDRDGVTIYCGDCREILPAIDAPQSAVVLADPPYGIALTNNDRDGHRAERAYTIANDTTDHVGQFIISHAAAHNWPLAVFASPWLPWPGEWRNLIVWDKGGAVGGGGDIATCLKRSWELIQVARNGPMNGPRDESVWRFPITPDDTKIHIAAKPVGLLCRIIRRFAAAGAVVIDPCCGSGSALVAARLCGHRAIGIEVDPAHCATAVKRLAQGVLFGLDGAA